MTTANDEKILKLKTQIEEKKANLKLSEKFSPVTNCSIEYLGTRYNLHAVSKEQAIDLLVKMNCLRLAAKDLGILGEYKVSGYTVEEWIVDLKSRLAILDRAAEMNKLKSMESRLVDLLSDEKQVELEISEIEKLL